MKCGNDKGIALLMVMSFIAVLAVISATFTYDTQLNLLRMSNIQEKLQARLNAESGLNFAMAQLRLYQEANNRVAKIKHLQSLVTPSRLEGAVTAVSLIYPVEAGGGNSEEGEDDEEYLVQKSAKDSFEKNNFIRGGINVSIQPIKGFLNPNRLVTSLKEKRPPPKPQKNSPEEPKKPPSLIVEEEMIKAIENLLDRKKESEPEFFKQYGDLEPELLVKELAWYVNRPEDFEDGERVRFEELYSREQIRAKHAPLTSLDELYLLRGWPDDIVDLLKDSLTVHENHSIPVNEIVRSQLEALFPELDEEQIEQFFKYRDGDPSQEWEPTPFENVEHFKNFLVNELDIDEEAYKRRAEDLERAKMKFGVVGKLYKIVSRGSFNRVHYVLTAFAEIPVRPPKKVRKPPRRGGRPASRPKKDTAKKEGPEILLPPKIVEIHIQ